MNNLTKHTPGPWQIDQDTIIGNIDGGYGDDGSRVKFDTICIMYDEYNEQLENWQANAQLIARAPELLEENESLKTQTEKLIGAVTLANEKLQNLKAINKQLLEALEPFGKLANECLNNSSMNQNQTVYAYNRATITMLDLKKVSEILSKSKL